MECCQRIELLRKKTELVNDHIVYLIVKRLIDIIGSGLGLIIAPSIMLIVAILIWNIQKD